MRFLLASLAVTALCAVTPAHAQGTTLYLPLKHATPAESTGSASVDTLSGGIGDVGMEEMRAVENNYSLKLTFAADNGMHLSDLPVVITDMKGNQLVNTVTQGPILLARLAPGTYKVTAMMEGQKRERTITVKENQLKAYTVVFRATES